jgi:hypothetical protein
MQPNFLRDLIYDGQEENYTAKETRTAHGLPAWFMAVEDRYPAALLHQYQNHWQQHNSFLYHSKQL